MSITGSLVGYENNNEIAIIKKTTSSSGLAPSNRSLLNITSTSGGSLTKPCPSLNSSISNSIITTASSNLGSGHHQHQQNAKNQNMSNRKNHQKQQHQQHQQKSYHQKHLEGHLHGGVGVGGGQRCDGQTPVSHLHLNSLWSIWYGILVTLFQGYLAVHGAYRFLGCSLVQWKIEPIVELNIQIVICGVVFILLPLFFASAVFKVGNLANDGIKLGSMAHSRCSISPHDGLEEEAKGGTIRALWTHGGPTAAFVHIIIAMCLLLPRLLLEARIIENGLLPRENIWRNELDFLGSNRERLVVMSFTTSPYQNRTIYGNDTNYYWDDDNSTSNLPQRNVEHVYKFYPKLPVYESEAVEQFAPENSEFMESHENLEMDPLSSSPAPIKLIKHSRIIATTPKNTPTTSTTSRTTKSIRTEGRRNGNGKNHRKQTHKHNKSGEEKRPHSKGVDLDRSVESKIEKFDLTGFREKDLLGSVEVSGNQRSTVQTPSRKRTSTTTTKSTQMAKSTSTAPTTLRTVSQTTSTKSSSLPDSDIHIVKPERLPEIIPSTPVTGNSKIIEIKTKKVQKRTVLNDSIDEDAVIVEILPEALIGAVPANLSSYTLMKLDGFSGVLQRFFGIEKPIDVSSFSHPPSMEFVNLVLALMVWSIRYPAVFWSTTKSFAAVFSIQMVANTVDIILSYIGVSTLYKLQIVGQILPMHTPGLLLNAVVTLALFILSMILTIASSLILYLYGHGRLAARMRDRCMITMKNSESWIYFAHCASLCLVLALAVVKAPLMHDLSATYRGSLDNAILAAALGSVIHLFLWIVLWLGLTAKRRWTFKLPPLAQYGITSGATQPLLINARDGHGDSKGMSTTSSTDGVEDTIYWPKMTPNSPKLKVTFNEVTSTCEDVLIIGEHDGKRCTTSGTAICITSVTGEADDGDYATLRGGAVQTSGSMNGMGGSSLSGVCAGSGGGGTMLHLSEYDELPPPPAQLLPPCNADCLDDNTSEEGKLLACVRDDSVTYASTRDLEPPQPPPPPPQHIEVMQLGSPVDLVSPLAPVTVTVHTNEAHIASSSTPRCLRRADSGVPNEALTPRSDTTSTTESTTSPPERAPSESSSGVHSGEEREEVVIRPRPVTKAVPKPPPPVIQEEPFSRSTNMKMSSFNIENKSSATLPLTRNAPETRVDYSHCSTMPLPMGCHQAQYKPQVYTPTASTKQLMHTTLPNGVRYSNPHLLRRIPHIAKAESPYGHLGLGAGHHTFSKLLQDPLHSLASTSIPEDRDSANFSMSSETERECLYANAQHIN